MLGGLHGLTHNEITSFREESGVCRAPRSAPTPAPTAAPTPAPTLSFHVVHGATSDMRPLKRPEEAGDAAGRWCPWPPSCCLVQRMPHVAGLQIKRDSTLESGPAVFIEVLLSISTQAVSKRFQT